MSIYLSIDLDYWKGSRKPERFLNRVISLRRPVAVRREHHELLGHMNRYSYDCLINIDWHSDLVENDMKLPCLDDGTWGNHIRAKNRNHYLWIYPSDSCVAGPDNMSSTGYCNAWANKNPFLVRNPKQVCGWERVSKRKQFITEREMDEVVAVGICYSPSFTSIAYNERVGQHMKKLGLQTFWG